ncbi:T9SS type A sorting domain-containing protein [bacterium]|nr:T9SS type A sorting domain-containing protein [bacterium]
MRLPAPISLIVFLLLLAAFPLFADPVQTVAPGRVWITVDDHEVCIPAISSHPMNQQLPEITRAIIVNPHYQREIVNVFNLLANSAQNHGVTDDLLIVGLQYLVATDVLYHDLPDDVLYWTLNTWQWGHESEDLPELPRPVFASSYTFIDSTAHRIADLCPNLELLMVMGQSAGAGMTQRYAGGTTLPGEFDSFTVTFLSSCLGHLMYLNEERRELGTNDVFTLPPASQIARCPGYNMYPYGLEDLNSYMAAQGADAIRQRYPTRWFVYLTGSLDNQLLPTFCPVLFQGFQRVQKHRVFWNYLNYLYGPAIQFRQRMFVVDGVGHSTYGMFNSDLGRFFLFDWNPEAADGPDPFARQVSRQESTVPSPAVQLNVHPNPFNEQVSVTVKDPSARALTVTLYDLLGRQTLQRELSASSGIRTLTIDASSLASGIYVLNVSTGGESLASRRVVLLR